MRAVAVGLVVAFHAGIGFLTGGYVGVDVFFVLSGFLITGLLVDELRRTGTISITQFYARRIRRLLPLSTLVLVVSVVASYWVIPRIDHAQTAGDVRAAALYFANWHFAGASTQYMADTDKSVVLHYWSLSVEEQFYVVWPLLLLLVVGRAGLARRDWATALRRIIPALAVLGLGSLALSVLTTQSSGPYAYFGLHTRAWELAAGAALALARPALPRIPRRLAVVTGWLGLGLLVLAAVVMGPTTPFPGSAALVPVLGTVMLVASGVPAAGTGAARLLSTRPFTFVGRISYGWYLWHWPLLVLARHATGTAGDPSKLGSTVHTPVWAVVGAVVLSFLLSIASRSLVEEPVRRSRWLSVMRARSLALGAGLTAVCVLAGAVLLTGGSASPAIAAGGMTPEQARADTVHAPPGCYVGPAGLVAGTSCMVGDANGTRTIVMVGDSKSAQWLPAVERAAKAKHWKVYVWFKAFCPFVDTAVWSDRQRYDACTRWRADVVHQISSLGKVDLVLMGRSSGYINRVVKPNGELTSAQDFGTYWQAATERMLDHLSATSTRFAVIRETPWPGSDVPACLSKSSGKGSCDFPRSKGANVDQPLAEAEAAARPKSGTRIGFVDVGDRICSTQQCRVVSPKGMILYRDDQHITASFAASLWQPLGARIQALMTE